MLIQHCSQQYQNTLQRLFYMKTIKQIIIFSFVKINCNLESMYAY